MAYVNGLNAAAVHVVNLVIHFSNIYAVFIVQKYPKWMRAHDAEAKFLCLVFIDVCGLLSVAFGKYDQATNTHELREAY